MDGKGHRVTLLKRDNLNAALHARPLFRQDELAACEVLTCLREKNRDLDWECEIAIQILMEAIEVTADVLQEQRRWTPLTGGVASREE